MRSPPEKPTEVECAKVVDRRYGDGTVYLPAGTPRALFYVCIQRGFISDEGFVTRKGRELLARYPVLGSDQPLHTHAVGPEGHVMLCCVV